MLLSLKKTRPNILSIGGVPITYFSDSMIWNELWMNKQYIVNKKLIFQNDKKHYQPIHHRGKHKKCEAALNNIMQQFKGADNDYD